MVYQLYCMVLYHSQTWRHMIKELTERFLSPIYSIMIIMWENLKGVKDISNVKVHLKDSHWKCRYFNRTMKSLVCQRAAVLFYPSGLQISVCIGKLFSLFLNQNICCGYSKESSHWDVSFEHPKHMFKLMGKKIFTILRQSNFLTWIYDPSQGLVQAM